MNWQIINTKQTHVEASNCLKNYFPVPVWKIINQLLPSFLKLHNIKHGQLRFCPAVYLGPGLWWHFTCVFVSPMHNFIWKSGNWLHFPVMKNSKYVEQIFWIALLLQWSLLGKKEVILGVLGAICSLRKWNQCLIGRFHKNLQI